MTDNSSRRRLLIFAVIGVFNTAVDVSIFLMLRHVHLSIIVANVISTSIALGGSYVLNKRYTFQANNTTRRSLPLFLLVTIAGLWILQPIVIKLSLVVLQTNVVSRLLELLVTQPDRYFELIDKLAATPATLTWNFIFYKHLVFKPAATTNSTVTKSES